MTILGVLQAVGNFKKKFGVVVVPVILGRCFIGGNPAAASGFDAAGNEFEGFVEGGKMDLVFVDAFLSDEFAQGGAGIVVAVIEKEAADDWGAFRDPVDQFTSICVGGVIAQAPDVGLNLVEFAVNLHVFSAAGDDVAEGAGGLVADKEDCTLVSLNIGF